MVSKQASTCRHTVETGQNEDDEVLRDPLQYVLDGGFLLHLLPWTQGETFETVCVRYVNYITRKYGKATMDQISKLQDIRDAVMDQDQLLH